MNAKHNDETLLIDFHLRRLDEPHAHEVRRRVEEDAAFASASRDVAHALGAVNLLPEREPPADLVARTMARIAQAKQDDDVVADEETARPLYRPTFSLREGVFVAASLLIIVSIFVPSMMEAKHAGRARLCRANIGQIGTGIQEFASAHDGLLPSAGGNTRWLPGREQGGGNSRALFLLVQGKYVPQTRFLCPAAESGQPYQITADMEDFPGHRNIHYSYQHTVGTQRLSREDPNLVNVASEMVILADATPFYRNRTFRADDPDSALSDNHNRTGQNVLYLDTHVGWTTRPQAGVKGDHIYLAEGIYTYSGDETPTSPTDTFLLPAHCGEE
ncbi:MAG: hypothetical protein FWE88_03675 [Phycisphaerae bacterium]|nr:hypothetical protein [Phycisphaerae bacterium]